MELLPVPWTCYLYPRRPPGSVHLGQPPHKKAFLARAELRALVVDGSAERPTTAGSAVPFHTVTVHDRQRGVVHRFQVPEDQYILHTAEAQNITLPFARISMFLAKTTLRSIQLGFSSGRLLFKIEGCCTSCAVRVKSGQIRQPEALGISPELKSQGYALLCVGFPSSDLEVETQDEDEVYWLQFGRYFARGPVERDDYALELAMADE